MYEKNDGEIGIWYLLGSKGWIRGVGDVKFNLNGVEFHAVNQRKLYCIFSFYLNFEMPPKNKKSDEPLFQYCFSFIITYWNEREQDIFEYTVNNGNDIPTFVAAQKICAQVAGKDAKNILKISLDYIGMDECKWLTDDKYKTYYAPKCFPNQFSGTNTEWDNFMDVIWSLREDITTVYDKLLASRNTKNKSYPKSTKASSTKKAKQATTSKTATASRAKIGPKKAAKPMKSK